MGLFWPFAADECILGKMSEMLEGDPCKVLLQGYEAKWAAKDKSTLQ